MANKVKTKKSLFDIYVSSHFFLFFFLIIYELLNMMSIFANIFQYKCYLRCIIINKELISLFVDLFSFSYLKVVNNLFVILAIKIK